MQFPKSQLFTRRRSAMKSFFCKALLTFIVFPACALAQNGLVYHSLTPCVAFDTRPAQGGTGIMGTNEARSFHVVGSSSDFFTQGGTAGGCDVPGFSGANAVAQAVFINLVAIGPTGRGQLKGWATDQTEPVQGAMVNYQSLTPPMSCSNAIALGVRLDAEGSDITLRAVSAAVHVRGVVLGYFTS